MIEPHAVGQDEVPALEYNSGRTRARLAVERFHQGFFVRSSGLPRKASAAASPPDHLSGKFRPCEKTASSGTRIVRDIRLMPCLPSEETLGARAEIMRSMSPSGPASCPTFCRARCQPLSRCGSPRMSSISCGRSFDACPGSPVPDPTSAATHGVVLQPASHISDGVCPSHCGTPLSAPEGRRHVDRRIVTHERSRPCENIAPTNTGTRPIARLPLADHGNRSPIENFGHLPFRKSPGTGNAKSSQPGAVSHG